MWTSSRAPLAALALTALLAGGARAQGSLGGQRAGTSSGTFLRIGVGARAVAMGESFVAVANDPSAIYWNPAGLASLQRREVGLSYVQWPADVDYGHIALIVPVKRLGGSVGLQFGVLATRMDETTELMPFGTGRSFSYSDVVAGATYARRWTDKLLVGAGLKYVHEDLGSQVGGPTTSAVLLDIGSIYYLGLGSVRIATSLTSFGPQLRPAGDWVSPLTGEVRQYDGFDPPMVFRYGLAFEPLENNTQRLTTALEVNQPADNEQNLKAGAEWTYLRRFALRSGYNFRADALKFSAGAGFVADVNDSRLNIDYAWTDGGPLGSVHRMTLGVRF
ncbi:MAG: PorV/PorQ family protein [Candidatus Eisenbacteria bacterium]|nr:PorV/PorQ family protein [Candidatus Eisenbacteria bacterium]